MLVALGFVTLLGVAILVDALVRAPEAFEDENGFHVNGPAHREEKRVTARAGHIFSIVSRETSKTTAPQSSHWTGTAFPTTGRALSGR
jgi:hypothetical protein